MCELPAEGRATIAEERRDVVSSMERLDRTMTKRNIDSIRIVSGGQTGADRSALDWALAHGVACGGWCPHGRRTEDGPLHPRYPLVETPLTAYEQRTDWNVRDSDATVIFSLSERLSGGSRVTREQALRRRKPCLHLHPGPGCTRPAAGIPGRTPATSPQHRRAASVEGAASRRVRAQSARPGAGATAQRTGVT